jgi:hypothetical protein
MSDISSQVNYWFECSICCEEVKPCKSSRRMISKCECPRCEYTVCSLCQTRFGRAECSLCHFEFPRLFIINSLGKSFLKNIAIPNITKKLMLVQRANLGATDVQNSINWINECNKIKKNSRFGGNLQLPPRPTLNGKTITHKHACTIGSCRGIALLFSETVSKCNTCSGIMCCACHCKLQNTSDTHVCDQHDLDVLNLSKPCPKCMSLIQHDGGCHDMICTNCSTKFNWNTGNIMTFTTNHHYSTDSKISVGCTTSFEYPRIALDVIMDIAEKTTNKVGINNFNNYPFKIIECLYNTTDAVREYSKDIFDNINNITSTWINKTHDLRIQYLTNNISDTKWSQQVYSLWTQYRYKLLHSDIINTFLIKTDDLQLYFRELLVDNAPTCEYNNILNEYEALVNICNSCFVDIFNTYPVTCSAMHICTIGEINENTKCSLFSKIPVEPKLDSIKKKVKKEKEQVVDTKEIQLIEYQVQHVVRLNNIFNTCHFALDLSMLGSGKTYTAMEIYKRRRYTQGLIIAPASMISKWRKLTNEYGLSGISIISFNALGGTKTGTSYSAQHLVRRGNSNGNNHIATNELVKCVQNGMMVIIDEIQNIKNKGTAKTSACKEIIRVIYDEYTKTHGNTNSRVLLISGSPIDNYAQIEQFFKTIGVMKSVQFERFNIGAFSRARYLHNQTGMNEAGNIETGLAEIHEFCMNYDKESANNIKYSDSSLSVLSHKNYQPSPAQKCYDYFITIIKPYLTSYMIISGNNCQVSKYNGMFPLKYGTDNNCDIIRLLKQGEASIRKGIQHIGGEGITITNSSVQCLQLIQRGLNMIETSKIPLFVQNARDALIKNPSCKVVIACNFTLTLSDLKRELSEFGVIVVDGSTSSKKRQHLIDQFQEPNLNVRVLVGNMKVISTGIDLDDKNGAFPRVCFVSPSYHTIDLYQMSYRFIRSTTTRSNSQMYVVYTTLKNEHDGERNLMGGEHHLMKALTKKSSIMKMITQEQSDLADITFPCDYDLFYPEHPQDENKWNKECNEIFNRSLDNIVNNIIV